MLFIIDGYNFIKTIFKKSHVSSKEINYCLSIVTSYAEKKQHQVIIVFDGFSSVYCGYYENIVIVYSEGQSADTYIKNYISNYIKNNKVNIVLVITSDQEITRFAHKFDIEALDSYSFYDKINKTINKHKPSQVNTVKQKKYDNQIYKLNDDNDDELDALMIDGSKKMVYKDQDYGLFNNSLNNVKLNKKKKKINKILKKI